MPATGKKVSSKALVVLALFGAALGLAPMVLLTLTVLYGPHDPVGRLLGDRELTLSDTPTTISTEPRDIAVEGHLPVRGVDSGVCFLLGTAPTMESADTERVFSDLFGATDVWDSPLEVVAVGLGGETHPLSRCVRTAEFVRFYRSDARVYVCQYLPASAEPPRAVVRISASSSVPFLAQAVEWRTSRPRR